MRLLKTSVIPLAAVILGIAAGTYGADALFANEAVAGQITRLTEKKVDTTVESVVIPKFMVSLVEKGRPRYHVLAEVAVDVMGGKEAVKQAEGRLPWMQAAIMAKTHALLGAAMNGKSIEMPDGSLVASVIAEAADKALPGVKVANAKVVNMAVFDGSAVKPAR